MTKTEAIRYKKWIKLKKNKRLSLKPDQMGNSVPHLTMDKL